MANAATRLLDSLRSGAVRAVSAAVSATGLGGAGAKVVSNVPGMSADKPHPQATRETTYGDEIIASMLGAWGMGIFPGSWSANRIEQTQHFRHWAWKAIRLIMDLSTKEAPLIVDARAKMDQQKHTAQTKAWIAGRGSRPEERRWLDSSSSFGNDVQRSRQKAMQVMKPHEVFEHVGQESPLKMLFDRPNNWDTGAELDQELLMYLELCGSSYEWLVPFKNAPGIAERWVIPAHWMWAQRSGKTNRIIDYYECRPWGQAASAAPVIFEYDEIVTYRYKSPLSKIDGCSPLQAGAETVDSYEQTQLARFFSIMNGANVGDVVELDASTDPNEEKMMRYLAQWKNRYQGVFNFGAPAVLPPGAELHRKDGEIELAYQQSSAQLRDFILGMWGLTKSIVGFMEDANRASFEAALAQCFYTVINPRLTLIDTIRTERIAQPYYGKTKRIFHRDMTPADRAMELQEWSAHAKIAPYTGNEFRQWRGMEPLPEGEEVIQPAQNQADPMAGMSDEELMGALGGGKPGQGKPGSEGGSDSARAGFAGAFGGKRFHLNGTN